MKTNAYVAQNATTPLAPFTFQRRDPGAHVVVFTHSPNKVKDALRLGADEVVYSKNEDDVNYQIESFTATQPRGDSSCPKQSH